MKKVIFILLITFAGIKAGDPAGDIFTIEGCTADAECGAFSYCDKTVNPHECKTFQIKPK
jgi:hypothetical protein